MTSTTIFLLLILSFVLLCLYLEWRIAKLAKDLEAQKEKDNDDSLKNLSLPDLVSTVNSMEDSSGSVPGNSSNER